MPHPGMQTTICVLRSLHYWRNTVPRPHSIPHTGSTVTQQVYSYSRITPTPMPVCRNYSSSIVHANTTSAMCTGYQTGRTIPVSADMGEVTVAGFASTHMHRSAKNCPMAIPLKRCTPSSVCWRNTTTIPACYSQSRIPGAPTRYACMPTPAAYPSSVIGTMGMRMMAWVRTAYMPGNCIFLTQFTKAPSRFMHLFPHGYPLVWHCRPYMIR